MGRTRVRLGGLICGRVRAAPKIRVRDCALENERHPVRSVSIWPIGREVREASGEETARSSIIVISGKERNDDGWRVRRVFEHGTGARGGGVRGNAFGGRIDAHALARRSTDSYRHRAPEREVSRERD